MKKMLLTSLLLGLIIIVNTQSVFATASGRTGATRLNGSGCTCHSGSTSSGVTWVIAGPSVLQAGATGTYTAKITSTSALSGVGVDIAASAGTLLNADANLKVSGGELTHPSAKSGTGTYTFNFKYTAPATTGPQTLYATGCRSYGGGWNNAPDFPVTVTPASTVPEITLSATAIAFGNVVQNTTAQKLLTITNSGGANLVISSIESSNAVFFVAPVSNLSIAPGLSSTITINYNPVDLTAASGNLTINHNATSTASPSVIAITGMGVIPSPYATLLWEENFDYPLADTVNGKYNGWASFSGTGQWASRIVSGLSYSGYPNSAVGNAIDIKNIGEDIAKKVVTPGDSIITGAGYVSFLVRVDTANTGDYFLFLGQYALTSTSAQRSRIYVKAGVAPNTIAFGVFKGSSTTLTAPVYTSESYSLGTTYHIVMKYNIVTGTTNDFCNLWVNPSLDGTEPTPTITDNSDATVSDLTSIGSLCLRQGTVTARQSVIVDGIRLAKDWNSAIGIVTAVKDAKNSKADGFELSQNYPNPFNPSTMISYNLAKEGFVSLKVYDVLGNEVNTLVSKQQTAGQYNVKFDASRLNSGVYFYTLTSGNSSLTKKLMLMK